MLSIINLIDFIKAEAEYHERKHSELEGSNPRAALRHSQSVEKFNAIVEVLNSCNDCISTENKCSSNVDDLFYLDPLSIDELPEELRKEINLSGSDLYDAQILDLLKIAGRPLTLNELLLGAYRKFKVQHKRTALTARLYRLAGDNKVISLSKGVYTLGSTPVELELLEQDDK